MERRYHSPFRRFTKKSTRPIQAAIEDAVEDICANPKIGKKKSGDLNFIQVYKFKFCRHEYLIAYKIIRSDTVEFMTIDFFKVGHHENFYSNLKRFLKDP